MQVTRIFSALTGTLTRKRLLSTVLSRGVIMEIDILGTDLAKPYLSCHGFIRRPGMARLARLFSAASAAMLIAACGGGGGDGTTATTTADPTDKYAGTWVSCIPSSTNATSIRVDFTATKIDAIHMSITTRDTIFANTSCTAPPVTPSFVIDALSGTAVIDGQATVQSKVVDKFTLTSNLPSVSPIKDIALVNGNQLQFGDAAASPTDVQGYPTTLDTIAIFARL